MNMNTVFIRAAIATAFVGLGFTSVHVPNAVAAPADVTMSVDARAPLHATLLPMLSVFANTGNPDAPATTRIANDDALSVTLMPTVYVSAQAPQLAAARQVQDVVAMAAATRLEAASLRMDATSQGVDHAEAAPALRVDAMPR